MNAIDTNVFMYFYDERDASKRSRATDLVKSTTEGVMLWQVALEFVAASRKLSTYGLPTELAWQRLEELLGLFQIVVPSSGVLHLARELMRTHQLQFWDAMVYAACIDAGVSRLYSEDLPGSSIPGLEIVNPFL